MRFLEGIDGAFLMVPFQCDLCWFRNLENRSPIADSHRDDRIMGYIRRVNLDLIWSRAPGTVNSTKQAVKNLIQSWRELGMQVDLPALGPWPVSDNVGFRLAIGQIKFSQRQGQNRKSHLQFDTVRKLRTAFSHVHETSQIQNASSMVSFRSMKGDSISVSSSPTESRFFKMFMQGMLLRMGKQIESNWGLDYRILIKMIENYESDLASLELDGDEKRWIIMSGSFFLIGFVCGLRGNEGFMVEAEGLQNYIEEGRISVMSQEPHVVIPLLGRFKNEDGEMWHFMASVNTTSSGLAVRKWVERLVMVLSSEGRGFGPAFCKENGEVISYGSMNAEFVKQIERVQQEFPELLKGDIDVGEHFSIFRSLRKGSTARATDVGVSEPAIDLHNRWRTIENSGGGKSKKSMRDYYSDLRLTLRVRLSYSRAL